MAQRGSETRPGPHAAGFPVGTVLANSITGERARVVVHTPDEVVGELVAVPGGAVAGPHRHPGQDETFEVLEGALGYRRGDELGELGPGESLTVPRGVVHDWWNAGEGDLRARVTVRPAGSFVLMIASIWGLAVSGRTNSKGMPGLLDAALLSEAFGEEIVFQRPPPAVQKLLATLVAPLARRAGRSVTSEEIVRAAVVEGKS